MKNILWLVIAAALIAVGAWFYMGRGAADGVDRAKVLGAWVMDEADGAGLHQGFELAEDGTVLSINTATLTYNGWSLDGDTLILMEQSTGSGGTSEEPYSYKVQALAGDGSTMELVDARGNAVKYRRETEDEKANNERFTPVAIQ